MKKRYIWGLRKSDSVFGIGPYSHGHIPTVTALVFDRREEGGEKGERASGEERTDAHRARARAPRACTSTASARTHPSHRAHRAHRARARAPRAHTGSACADMLRTYAK